MVSLPSRATVAAAALALLPMSALAAPATAAPASLTTTWSTSAVTVGQPVVVSGTVAGASGRPVLVEYKYGGRWTKVAGTTTRDGGTYRVPVKLTWLNSHPARVRVPASAGKPAATSPVTTITVSAADTWGRARSWSLGPGVPFRWNACKPITYKVRLADARPGSLEDVHVAVAEIREATGLRFRYAGTTSTNPVRLVDGYPWPVKVPGADLVFSWSSPRKTPYLKGKLGTASKYGRIDGTKWREILYASVLISTAPEVRYDKDTIGSEFFQRSVLVHELAHAVGVDHTDDRAMLMYPSTNSVWLEDNYLGAGDLTGLRKVGAAVPCFPRSAR